jgi:hypothetical protein
LDRNVAPTRPIAYHPDGEPAATGAAA